MPDNPDTYALRKYLPLDKYNNIVLHADLPETDEDKVPSADRLAELGALIEAIEIAGGRVASCTSYGASIDVLLAADATDAVLAAATAHVKEADVLARVRNPGGISVVDSVSGPLP